MGLESFWGTLIPSGIFFGGLLNIEEFLGVFTVSFIAAVVCFQLGRKRHRIHQLMVNTQTSKTDALTEGPCEVQGEVEAIGSPFISPWTQQQCVYYDFQVKERRTRKSGKTTTTYWAKYVADLQVRPFTLKDSSGTVEINPAGADFSVSVDARDKSGLGDDAPAQLQMLLRDRYDASTQGWVFNKTLRYSENVLAVGDTVYIFGEARWKGDKLVIGGGLMPLIITEHGVHLEEMVYAKSATRYLVGMIISILIVLATIVLGLVSFYIG